MPKWTAPKLTTKGKLLQAKAEAGALIALTKIKLGDGSPDTSALESLTDLVNVKQTAGVSAYEVSEDNLWAKISATISNKDLAAGYYVREMGVYADDPDDGEILYAVTVDEEPDYFPAKTNAVVTQEFSLYIVAENAENVTAEIDSGALATTAGVAKLISDHDTSDTAHYDMKGATASANGKRGFVPAPEMGDQLDYLTGGGRWEDPLSRLLGLAGGKMSGDIDMQGNLINFLASGGKLQFKNAAGTVIGTLDATGYTGKAATAGTADVANVANKTAKTLSFTGGATGSWNGSADKSIAIPTALKNPNAITFTGAATGTYDGSAAKTINIPTVATQLTTNDVGSGTKPIYLAKGIPTASGSTVGSATTPIYLKNGTLTAGSPAISAASLAANGYVKFVNGLIIQWGMGGSSFTYPIALSNVFTVAFSLNSAVWSYNWYTQDSRLYISTTKAYNPKGFPYNWLVLGN